MQALSRSRALVRAISGRAGRQDFEYRRNGTRCLCACFNIGTGRVLGRCTVQRRREDFLSFMDLVAATYRQTCVHVGSWLNQVESWFGIMTRRVLRHGDFHHPDQLEDAAEAFIEIWNDQEAHPFRWTCRGTPLVS